MYKIKQIGVHVLVAPLHLFVCHKHLNDQDNQNTVKKKCSIWIKYLKYMHMAVQLKCCTLIEVYWDGIWPQRNFCSFDPIWLHLSDETVRPLVLYTCWLCQGHVNLEIPHRGISIQLLWFLSRQILLELLS